VSLSKSSESPKFTDLCIPLNADGTPLFVTFKTGADLLVERGLVESITPDGLRYIARKVDTWPFGSGPEKLAYGKVGNIRTMETGAFLDYFKEGPPRGGRGRTRKS
jgi:hypothetical protein